jgi:hypothetical protein
MNVFQREANTLQFRENYHNGLAHREECREIREKCNEGEGIGNQGWGIRKWEVRIGSIKSDFSLPAFDPGFYNTFIHNKFNGFANRICARRRGVCTRKQGVYAHKMGFKNPKGVFAHTKRVLKISKGCLRTQNGF